MTVLLNLGKRFEKLLYAFFCGESQTVDYVNGADQLPPPLSKDEEQKAFELLKTDEKKARELLIIHNLRLVVYIAKKFETTGIGIEDLVSIGTIGLIKAVKTFDPDKNIKLATYASRCIENEILMFLRKASQYKNEISIDEPLNTDWDGNELLLSDILGTEDDIVNKGIETEVEKQVLRDEINKLDEREKMIMQMRFGLAGERELTQKQVADKVGISQSYISRLEKRIIKSIRKKMEKIC
jgi:RNA polymerase sporulation-specific sigma factor